MIFIDEICSRSPKRQFETNKIIYNHIDEVWSIDSADMIDYKVSNNERFRYVFFIIDKFSKHTWAVPQKNEKTQTITNDFLYILAPLFISKRPPVKL